MKKLGVLALSLLSMTATQVRAETIVDYVNRRDKEIHKAARGGTITSGNLLSLIKAWPSKTGKCTLFRSVNFKHTTTEAHFSTLDGYDGPMTTLEFLKDHGPGTAEIGFMSLRGVQDAYEAFEGNDRVSVVYYNHTSTPNPTNPLLWLIPSRSDRETKAIFEFQNTKLISVNFYRYNGGPGMNDESYETFTCADE